MGRAVIYDMCRAVDLEVLQKMRAHKHVRNVRTGQTHEEHAQKWANTCPAHISLCLSPWSLSRRM